VHENSRLLFERYALEYFDPELSVLEIGPDGSPSEYRQLVGNKAGTWHSVELGAGPGITYEAIGEYEYPIEDGAYDIVLSGQVLEHVPRIWLWMRELSRVCKASGVVITINPVSWPFHKQPRDCWRAYPDGMRALYEDSSLDVLLSTWESLESPGYKRYIPGRSRNDQRRLKQVLSTLLGPVGFPVERSYDTITIGRKR
jgi:SAM-dependent methyltransferase